MLVLIGTLSSLRAKPDDPAYPNNMSPSITELQRIADDSNFPENCELAGDAVIAVVGGVMDHALDRLAGVAKRIGPAGTELERARNIAIEANRNSTLPMIASVSAVALTSLENLLEAVKKFNSGDLDESATAMELTIKNLKQLLDSLPHT